MIYGNLLTIDNKKINNSNTIYENAINAICSFNEEYTFFNKLASSSLVLQESGIVFEFSLAEVKTKIKTMWEKFKAFWKKIWDAIKEKFNNIINKFKKQKVDKAISELEKNEKNASKEDIEAAYTKLFDSIYTNEDSDKHLNVPFYFLDSQKIKNLINTCNSENVFEKIVTLVGENRNETVTDQDKIDKIKKHNEEVEKQIIEPAIKEIEIIEKYDKSFDPKDIATSKYIHNKGTITGFIYPDTAKFSSYHTVSSVIKSILSSTPDDYFFSAGNPLRDTIKKYEEKLSKALAGEIHGTNISYLMSGLSYDISMMKKQIRLNEILYHATYGCIHYNMAVVYYLAEKFNIYLGRGFSDNDYKKLNKYTDGFYSPYDRAHEA